MKLTLSNGEFTQVPTGEQTLTITSAVVVPSGAPQFAEVTFTHANGGTIKSKYDLHHEMGKMIFSILVRHTLGNIGTFDTDDIGELVGKAIVADVEHRQVESKKEEGKMLIFPQIKRINGPAKAVEPTIEEDDI